MTLVLLSSCEANKREAHKQQIISNITRPYTLFLIFQSLFIQCLQQQQSRSTYVFGLGLVSLTTAGCCSTGATSGGTLSSGVDSVSMGGGGSCGASMTASSSFFLDRVSF